MSEADQDDEQFEGESYCWKCGGTGIIITCCDDLCQGQGYCMHGDGEIVCDLCNGKD